MTPACVTAVRPLHDRWMRLWFEDGAVIDVDVAPLIAQGEIFEHIRNDRAVFEDMYLDGGSVVWRGDIGFCPDVLYGHYEPGDGTRFERRVVRSGSDSSA